VGPAYWGRVYKKKTKSAWKKEINHLGFKETLKKKTNGGGGKRGKKEGKGQPFFVGWCWRNWKKKNPKKGCKALSRYGAKKKERGKDNRPQRVAKKKWKPK